MSALEAAAKPSATATGGRSPLVTAWRRLRRMPGPMIGLTIFSILVLMAIFAPLLAPHDPIKDANVMNAFAKPGKEFLFGADHAGRDVLSRLLYGARISLTVGLVVQAVSLTIGTTLGLLAGYYGGWLDDVISGITTVLQAFPGLLFAIAVMAVLGPGLYNVFLALGLVGWPTVSRLVRGEVLALREREFVQGAKALGAKDIRILFKHLLPNCLGPMIVVVTLGIGGAILSEASLSFLGLGTQPPTPSWGAMLAAGRNNLWDAPWLTVYPGLAIFLTILSLNLLGDGLRDALDPKLKQ
ncbi:MAG TPA: ABC transporter permease [Symbiobacteriaceae bacterium]|nr:ABC transporter permease [Symbiobacteriaceae bacterium]